MPRPTHVSLAATSALGAALIVTACGDDVAGPSSSRPPDSGTAADAPSPALTASPLVVSAAQPRPRTTTWSINYWQWSPTFGDDVSGTEGAIAPLATAVMRIGGYNNDANTPDPFDDPQLDAAVTYARAIGAEPLLQVPHLADTTGAPPTAATGAAMVQYANVTRAYGIKYFAVGNEPDLYATQGLPSDMTQPAIPDYTPAAFCASARDYVAAMKAVDPSIQIVGPDLGYQYQRGSDWLTPILQGCGDLFDVVSVHRYPFSSTQATLANARGDVAAFRDTMASVRGLVDAAGYAAKPLALTEMNIVYDATAPGTALDASPGTVGSALWLADVLGEAIEAGLWTSAVWDTSDDPGWALGLLAPAPAHTPRPQYYAYALYAAHFGPTLVDVVQVPAGVGAHASRDAAGDATDVIAVNWSAAPAAVGVEVTGLPAAPAPAIFALPGHSVSALHVPDIGAPAGQTYGDAQLATGAGLQPLSPSTGVVIDDAGPPDDAGEAAAPSCPTIGLPSPVITTAGTGSGASVSFGAAPNAWGLFTYQGGAQPAPTAAVTADGDGLDITAGLVAPVEGDNYAGVGLYYSSNACVDGSGYTGVSFDLGGTLGGCTLMVGVQSSDDVAAASSPGRGTCAATSCYGPTAVVPVPGGTVRVPFAALSGGNPDATLDPASIVNVAWQIQAPLGAADAGGCAADFTVENVAFY